MARSRRPAPRAAPAPAARPIPQSRTQTAPPPAPSYAPPPPAYPPQASGGGGMMSGIMGGVVQGMAVGTGSAIAHRAVDSLMGPRTMSVVHENTSAPAAETPAPTASAAAGDVCGNQQKAFQDCLSAYSDVTKCQFYFDSLKQCQQGGSVLA